MNTSNTKGVAQTFDKELGQRLKALRQMKNLSQKYLAERLGISFQQLQKYENGSNRMPPDRIALSAQVLGMNINYFFGMEKQEQKPSYTGFNKIVLCMAGEIMAIPDMEVRKSLYHLVRVINKAMNQNVEASIQEASIPSRIV